MGFFQATEVVPIAVDGDLVKDLLMQSLPTTITAKALARHLYSKEEAVLDFVRLCAGKENAAHKISLLFNPHRLNTRTVLKGGIVDAWNADERHRKGIVRCMVWKMDGQSPKEALYQALQLAGDWAQYVNEFPPVAAREHFRSYGVSRILDPCAGWGGRMIAAASIGAFYEGFEPSTRTHAGLLRLGEWLKQFNTGFDFRVHCQPFEEATVKGSFDLAYTSPPYYDTEHYAPTEKTNSMNRYGSFEEWLEGFYHPMIRKALEHSGKFVLNVGARKYDLITPLEQYNWRPISGRIAGKAGLGKAAAGAESFYLITGENTNA